MPQSLGFKSNSAGFGGITPEDIISKPCISGIENLRSFKFKSLFVI